MPPPAPPPAPPGSAGRPAFPTDRQLLDDARFRQVVDSITDYAIFLLTPDGRIASWNAGAERLKGWRADEIIGRHFSTFYPPEAIAIGWPDEELRRATAAGRFEDEGWRVRKDGSRFWANVVISAVRDDAGQLIGFSKVTRDLTERRAQEQRLRESEESLRLVVEGVRDHAMFLLDADGMVQSWNSGAQRVLGHTDGEIVGQSVANLYSEEEREAGRPLAELLSARHAGFFESDGWRLRADGTPLFVHATLTALKEPGGALRGYVQILRDLSERLRVRQLESEAERIHSFIAMLSHELRNPLAPIANAVRVLHRHEEDPDVRWCANLIERQTSHLTRLVDDLLDVSRITRGKVRLKTRPLRLDALVRDAVESHRPGFTAAGQTLTLTLPPEPVVVEGDPTRLHQVLANLLSNATKYTPDGGRVDVVVTRDAPVASVQVTDNGIGMSDALMQHAFEPFVQGNRALDRREGGLGIGLTLVKSVVELHGGRVAVASAGQDRGTRFTLTLPLARGTGAVAGLSASPGGTAAAPRSAPPSAATVPAGERPAPAPAAPGQRRLLVVDDNRDAADSLGELLRLYGHDVRLAHDGPTALRLAQEFPPEVVLLDLGLPGMDGFEVARQMRAMPSMRGARLVALTGYGQPSDRQATAAAGFDAHLVKPVDLDALLPVVEGSEVAPASGH